MKSKKSWYEKLHDSKDLPKVVKIEGKMTKKWGEGTCVVPAPIEVDDIMKKIPKGKLVTINQIRDKLAKKHSANISCPITTGIFAWISAHAAYEQMLEGKKKITPYWRTLKSDGEINPKYPGNKIEIKTLLESEGHKLIQKGKKLFVLDYENKLTKI
jgi:hypothetical protein